VSDTATMHRSRAVPKERPPERDDPDRADDRNGDGRASVESDRH
jgi:hypothetical protein